LISRTHQEDSMQGCYYLRLIPARTVGATFDRVHEISAPAGVVEVGRSRIPKIVPVGTWRSGAEFDRRCVATGLSCFWRPHLPGDESLPRARLDDLDCDPGTFVSVQEDAGTEDDRVELIEAATSPAIEPASEPALEAAAPSPPPQPGVAGPPIPSEWCGALLDGHWQPWVDRLSVTWRQRWAERAEAHQRAGCDWDTAEYWAWRELLLELEAAESPPWPPRPAELARWPLSWRQRWGELAAYFEVVEGLPFPESERRAFQIVKAEKETAPHG
jgi:hypothetical protein